MPGHSSNPRRFFLQAAAGAGLATLSGSALARSFLGSSGRFEWIPSECADERYPMQLITGRLHCSDGAIVPVPTGKIVNNGWGEIGSRRLEGSVQKPVPELLKLSWFSFSEDKFFSGTVSLPQAALTQLFEDGFEEPMTRTRVTWSKIIVGMGLGGWTSVWLAGSGIVKEVARAQLEPAQLDWVSVLDNPAIERSEYVRSKLQARLSKADFSALVRHGAPASTWPRYAKRYRWRIEVGGNYVPLHMFVRSYNGERQFYDFLQSPPEVLESVPKHVQITWKSNSGGKLLSELRFDESEVYGAFDRVSTAASEMSPITLRVELGRRSQVSIVLANRTNRMPLTHSLVVVSSLGK